MVGDQHPLDKGSSSCTNGERPPVRYDVPVEITFRPDGTLGAGSLCRLAERAMDREAKREHKAGYALQASATYVRLRGFDSNPHFHPA